MAIPGLENFEPKERRWEDNPHFKDLNPKVARAITQLQGAKSDSKIESNFLKSSNLESSQTTKPNFEGDSLYSRQKFDREIKQVDTFKEVSGFAKGIVGVVRDSMKLAHGFYNIIQGRRPTKFETARNNYRRKARSGPNLDKNYAKNLLKLAFPDTDLKNIDTKIAELERDGIDKNSREIKFLKDIKNSL